MRGSWRLLFKGQRGWWCRGRMEWGGVRYSHQDTWRMEDAVWSVLVAGYVLGYSLTMKSKNNDKIRVMIIITTISSMMSRHVVSTAPICGYRSVFGLLSEHVPKPPHMHRSHVGLGLIRTVHNSLLHEGLKYILQQGTCKRCGSLLTTTSRNLCCCFFEKTSKATTVMSKQPKAFDIAKRSRFGVVKRQ